MNTTCRPLRLITNNTTIAEKESDRVEYKTASSDRLSSDSLDSSSFNTLDVSVQVKHGTNSAKSINTQSRWTRCLRRAKMILRRGSNSEGYEVAPRSSHDPCQEEKGNDIMMEQDNVIVLSSSLATATEWERYFQAVWMRRQWSMSQSICMAWNSNILHFSIHLNICI